MKLKHSGPRQKLTLQFWIKLNNINFFCVHKTIFFVQVNGTISAPNVGCIIVIMRFFFSHSCFLEWSGVRAHHPEALVGRPVENTPLTSHSISSTYVILKCLYGRVHAVDVHLHFRYSIKTCVHHCTRREDVQGVEDVFSWGPVVRRTN